MSLPVESGIMSARESISALLATRGKGGSVESITQASKHFSADKTLVPSNFITADKLDSAKALVLFGGFISYKYGIDAKAVYALRETISKKYEVINTILDYDKDDFLAELNGLKASMDAKTAIDTAEKDKFGITDEQNLKAAFKVASKVTYIKTPKARQEALDLIAHLQTLVAYKPVEELISA